MQVLAISGSLRARSINTAVLQAAARLAPAPMMLTLYDELAQLPLFNPDIEEAGLPEVVVRLRAEVGRCDALLICSPEYARGVSGVMKNALDWLVGSLEFPDKRVAVINASQRATSADAHIRLTLETMSARIVQEASITLPLLGFNHGAAEIVSDPRFAEPLRAALAELERALSA